MELELASSLITVTFLVFTYIVVKLWKTVKCYSALNQIPGPKRLPLIGNLHLFAGDSRPPHQIFRDLALKYGALVHLQMGEVHFLIVSSSEAAKQVLKTHDITFANRPPWLVALPFSYNYTNIGFASYGAYWRFLRKICTLELLSGRRVKSFQGLREEENLELAKWIASNEGSPVNLSERIYLSSFDIITRASIGKKTEDRERITSTLKQIVVLSSGFSIADLYPSFKSLPLITGLKLKMERIFRLTDGVLESIVNQHRVAKPEGSTEDLVDVLLKYQEDGDEVSLTNDNIKAVLLDMFLAGGETSGIVVGWAMSEMMRDPSRLKRAQEEVRNAFDGKGYVDEAELDGLKYLKLVITETMRLHPPLPLLVPRYNKESCEINGYEIPAKTTVLINAWALGRDPKYWDKADKFIPERFMDSSADHFKGNNLEYIPFGSGRRMCPGITLGLANLEFTLANLLYHFDWEMPNGKRCEQLDMEEAIGMTTKRKHDLQLIPTLKRPLHF